ncbi:MAG TPA: hypothetical protein VMC78_17250 [Mycobacterium sp.]|nr:hypothetical protein [Mycobacterium sp.]
MMRDVYARSTLVSTAIAAAAISLAAPAAATPGPGNHSPSYQNGYDTEHQYYSTPQNHTFLKGEMKNGYTTATVCQLEMSGGAPPPNAADWIRGCMDALHDLGFAP